MPVSMAEDNVIPGPWDNVEDDERLRRIIAMAEQDGVEILTDDEAAEYEAATAPENRGDASMHYANLADFVEENVLDRLATDVIEWVERDEASRADWYARERKGIELMGLIDDTKWVAPFRGFSGGASADRRGLHQLPGPGDRRALASRRTGQVRGHGVCDT